MAQDKKTCSVCRKSKPMEQFEPKVRPTGTVSYRKTCRSCYQKKRYQNVTQDPYKFLALIFTQLKSSRKKKRPDLKWNITLDDVIDVWDEQEGRCALSGVLMTHAKDGQGKKELNASLDRILPHEGYVVGNIQLVTHRVNIMKHNLSEDMFFWWCKNIIDFKSKN